ncbi:uncharacterized protein VTP21DRAFT_8536 [Calcarisporiella thermophila]|uniref:uncharacterized protein n=1 Tax=Calcarisporiella thermophila TaxID=911321 RepID=UPI0037446BEC
MHDRCTLAVVVWKHLEFIWAGTKGNNNLQAMTIKCDKGQRSLFRGGNETQKHRGENKRKKIYLNLLEVLNQKRSRTIK